MITSSLGKVHVDRFDILGRSNSCPGAWQIFFLCGPFCAAGVVRRYRSSLIESVVWQKKRFKEAFSFWQCHNLIVRGCEGLTTQV